MKKTLSYLHTPISSKVYLPVETTKQELPFDQLTWEDFEKLCLRVVQLKFSIHDCEVYGIKGQNQQGIDIFAKQDNGKYQSYQCKKYQKIAENDLANIVTKFKEGDWFDKSNAFIICTSCSLNKTELQNKFNDLKTYLKSYGVSLQKWDSIQLNTILKKHPQIIYDFFGRAWAKAFCGAESLHQISENRKLDVNEVRKLRKELKKVYAIVFQQHELVIPTQNLSQIPPLEDRFIVPYILGKDKISVYNKLLTYNKSIILGNAGSGKSTVLRFLVLGLFSQNPKLENLIKQWGSYLPIWLPFPFITRQLAREENLSLVEITKLWFKSIGKESLNSLVINALADERLLLLIDGVGESNLRVARLAIDKIQIQANLNQTKVIYSSRLYSYQLLQHALVNVERLVLAPFTEYQQREHIFYWFKIWKKELNQLGENWAKNKTEQFINKLRQSPQLKELAKTPLFLNILIRQKLSNGFLPKNKLEVLKVIVNQLLDKYQENQKVDFDFDVKEVFQILAIHVHKNNNDGILLKSDAQKVVTKYLQQMLSYPKAKAKKISKELLTIGVKEIGIIIEKSNEEVAFFHRLFQEFLAAEYLLESNEEQASILQTYAANPAWYETIQHFFALIPSRKQNDFKGLITCISTKKTEKDLGIVNYVAYLKYKLCLNLPNTPIDLAKVNFKKIIEEFEYETNEIRKKALWQIILEATVQSSIKNQICEYVFNYFPNHFEYEDPRILGLSNVPYDKLKEHQKAFLVKAVINGNVWQQLNASNVMQQFMEDKWISDKVLKLLNSTTNPAILPYILNCIIAPTVSQEVKLDIVRKFENSEFAQVILFTIKLKTHLNTHTLTNLLQLFKILPHISKLLQEEAIAIFIEGWKDNEVLLEYCFEQLAAYSRLENQHIYEDKHIFWRILFGSFSHRKIVLFKVIEELTSGTRFTPIGEYKIWKDVVFYFKGNEKLTQVIDKLLQENKFNDEEASYLSLIGKTDTAKNYLLEHLGNIYTSTLFLETLLTAWPNDEEVDEKITSYLENKEALLYNIKFIPIVFKKNKQLGIFRLEEIIFGENGIYAVRAIAALIVLDKMYFETFWLSKVIEKVLPTLFSTYRGEYFDIMNVIVKNYHAVDVVRNYAYKALTNHAKGIEILLKYYYDDFVDKFYTVAQPLPVVYRKQLVTKLSDAIVGNEKIKKQLGRYLEEANAEIKIDATIGFLSECTISVNKEYFFFASIHEQRIYLQSFFIECVFHQQFSKYFALKKEFDGKWTTLNTALPYHNWCMTVSMKEFVLKHFITIAEESQKHQYKLLPFLAEEQEFWGLLLTAVLKSPSFNDKKEEIEEFVVKKQPQFKKIFDQISRFVPKVAYAGSYYEIKDKNLANAIRLLHPKSSMLKNTLLNFIRYGSKA